MGEGAPTNGRQATNKDEKQQQQQKKNADRMKTSERGTTPRACRGAP